MSQTVTVWSDGEVQWPNRCAKCGTKANLVAAGASIGRVQSIRPTISGGLAVKGELLNLDYPVCQAHAKGLGFANLVTRKSSGYTFLRGFIYLMGAMALSLFAMLPFKLLSSTPSKTSFPWEMWALNVVFAVAFLMILNAYRKLPLRLVKMDDESVTIKFKNDAYAAEFARLNKAS